MSKTTIIQKNLWYWMRQAVEKIISQRRAHHPRMREPKSKTPEKFHTYEIMKESIFIGHR
ncbi:MAG: hypothetical protein ACOY16_08150 [Chloroflexota bacterium]